MGYDLQGMGLWPPIGHSNSPKVGPVGGAQGPYLTDSTSWSALDLAPTKGYPKAWDRSSLLVGYMEMVGSNANI